MNKKDTVLNNLKDSGVHIFHEFLDQSAISALYEKLISKRPFDSSIFMAEEEYLKQENHLNANPTKDFNFLNEFESDLELIEKNSDIESIIKTLLGDDYEIVIKKAVCGVPHSWLPQWISEKIQDINVANLGAYLKPEFRDITYFRGIDFHQDIIDWPKGSVDLDPSTFITLYIYLHEVTELDSPLHVLPKSHKLGATLFPHKLSHMNDNLWRYTDDKNNSQDCQDTVLTGGPGYVGLWHNCTLHGTMPVKNESENFRLSLRYLIGKSNSCKARTFIDDINNNINGELRPIRTRKDLDTDGVAVIKGNIINNSEK